MSGRPDTPRAQPGPAGEDRLLESIGAYLAGCGVDKDTIDEQARRLRYFLPGGTAPTPVQASVVPRRRAEGTRPVRRCARDDAGLS